ncbi:MAG: DUF962 domain-containing protein [Gammaproteobacteria bacterium]|nr:DUF962 domain-containing protein [Gammaproteobacteria bacterium]
MSQLDEINLRRFETFNAFYPFYLAEHANRTSRRLHFIGTALVLATALAALFLAEAVWLWLLPVFGYGFAWIGHYLFEKNRPATFRHPFKEPVS